MELTEQELNIVQNYIKKHYKPVRRKLSSRNCIGGINDEFGSAPICGFSLKEEETLKEKIRIRQEATWQESIFRIIDEKGYSDVDVYKKSWISKQVFSKIRSDKNYQPTKDTAIKLCIGLELSLDETKDLLAKAGFALSDGMTRDLIIECFIDQKWYDLIRLNEAISKNGYKEFTA